MRSMSRVLAVVAVGSSLVVAGCGGGDDDEKLISDAIKTGFTTKDLKVKCEEIVTKDFVKKVYGDVAQCKKAEKPDPGDNPPTSTETADVKIDGDTATAKTTVKGGDPDGSVGTVTLRKEDGDWRVHDLGADILRSTLEHEIQKDDDPTFANPKVKSCVVDKFGGLSDADLQRLAYAAIGERKEAEKELGQLILPCLTESGADGEASPLRKQIEEGLTQTLKGQGASQSVIDCVKSELRKRISDDDLAKFAQTGKQSELTKVAGDAVRSCQTSAG